jgi:hypothetical protein
MCALQDGRLCIGFDNGKVQIWNTTACKCELRLGMGDNRNLRIIIQLNDGRICTGGPYVNYDSTHVNYGSTIKLL